MSLFKSFRKHIITNDQIKLSYIDIGHGKPLVMIPGWSQTAEEFKYQIEEFSKNYRCIAIDMRGHGESEKVQYGYKISRLSKDLYDVLEALDLNDIILMGHSMGCNVIWTYWSLFGSHRLDRLILIDEYAHSLKENGLTNQEQKKYGCIIDCCEAIKRSEAIAGQNGNDFSTKLVTDMFSEAAPQKTIDWVIEQNFKLPRIYAAILLKSLYANDCRDIIPRINIPTLIIGGKGSFIPWQSQIWIHEQIVNSKLKIFEKNEGGSHFMFIENPIKFNQVVSKFIN
ncbi:MAG TPA: alpha/beta hydrolase [Victivallales bacterium]|nr:alpha/beta hydrolase [Victivallales bacterium]